MSRFDGEFLERAIRLVSLYPERRSALIPLCHLAQEQDGYLTREAISHIAELIGTTPAEVYGTASFYEMIKLEPCGKYLIGVCTNIACMLNGAYELLEKAEESLGISVGETTEDRTFTLEEVECVAHCDKAPALQVNYRFFGPMTEGSLLDLISELRSGAREAEIPPHGTLSRVQRKAPSPIPMAEIDEERMAQDRSKEARLANKEGAE
jgi:NADH-quinone oxidoreductase subunit E